MSLLPPTPRPPRLSEQLDQVIQAFAERPVSLGEVIAIMHQRAYSFLLIILSLPFCLPFPIPGLSSLLGAVIALIGARLALGQKPWLPEAILQKKLPAHFLPRLLHGAQTIIRWLEYFLQPRLSFIMKLPLVHNVGGLIIMTSGLLLLLPLPVPLSNIIPALAIIFIACATIEEDGLFFLLGLGWFFVTLAFFAAIFYGGAAAIIWLKTTTQHFFHPAS